MTNTNTASGAADKALAYLDDLSDDAAAHIFPSDLAKCMTSECVVEVCSVRAGNPNEKTVPLFSREQVVAALASAAAPAQQPNTACAALPAECDSPELCAVSRSCAGQFGTKRICASRGQAPAQAAPAAVAGQSEMHEAMCPALTGGRCTCERNDPAVDKAWARFCGGIGDGPDAPYPGMISAFERYYSQSFTDKDWRNEASVWAAAWKQALLTAAAPTTQPAPDEIINMAREQGLPETETEGVFRVNVDDLGRMFAADRAARAPADSVTAPAAYSGNIEQELAMLIRRIVSSARRNCEDGSNVLKLANEAWVYLVRKGLNGSPLRDAGIESDPTPAAQAADSVLEDAARYRHIRDVPHSEEVRSVLIHQQNAVMDRVIDKDRAAMAAKKGGE